MYNQGPLSLFGNGEAVHIVLDSRDSGRTGFYAEVEESDARRRTLLKIFLLVTIRIQFV